MLEGQNLEAIIAVALFLAGMFLSDYRKRGERQGAQNVDMGRFETRLAAVERQHEEYSQLQITVAELKTEVRNLRGDLRDMGLTLREILSGRAVRP